MSTQTRDRSPSRRLCLALTCSLVIALAPTAQAEIDRIEYWWDCDPATTFALDLTNAVEVACGTYDYYMEAPASPSFVDVQIPACVKAGHHVLTFRAGELGGAWGPVYAIPVLIPPPANLQIVGGEWFLSDPAFMQAPAEGTGYPLDANTIASFQDCASFLNDDGWLSIDIPAGTLPGSYAIGFRLQDSESVWGPVRWESLLVEQANFPVTSVSLVDDAWIDDIIDPHWVCGTTAVPLQPEPLNPGWYSADVLLADFPAQEGYAHISFQVGNQVFDVLRYVSLAPVVNANPLAVINAAPLAGQAPLVVTFNGAQSNDDGTIVSYAWVFGDCATGQGIQTSHTYTAPGVYTAVLTVTDNCGSTDTASVTITVDAAGITFRRGDTNADGRVDIGDAICMNSYLFSSVATHPCKVCVPNCFDAGDANDDGQLDIADTIKILGHLFAQAGPLPDPFATCGIDPTREQPTELTCVTFPPCD